MTFTGNKIIFVNKIYFRKNESNLKSHITARVNKVSVSYAVS